MGIVLGCLGIAGSSYKDKRDKKKAAKINENYEPQPLSQTQGQAQVQQDSAVQDATRALRDEHLAVPPALSTNVERTEKGEDTLGPETEGVREIQREITVEAPVQVPTATPSSSDQPTERNTKDKMASDEDYAAFLDKANQDPNEGVRKTQSSSKVELKAVDKGVAVPACLKKATKNAFYVSDADEPFEPVCLKHSGKTLPDEVTFARLVNHPSPDDAEVTIMDIGEWDTQGQYKDVVDATREASKGSDIRVYRISKGGPRIEYWVVGLEGGKLVGVKALAIES